MSKLSITENNWINLVFEGKNKEYGAYQLRQESDKTTLIAFFMSLLILTSLFSIPVFINLLVKPKNIKIEIPDYSNTPVILSNYTPKKSEKSIKLVMPLTKKSDSEIIKKEQLINPILVKPSDANQNISENKDNASKSISDAEDTTTGINVTPTFGTETGTGTVLETTSISEDTINTIGTLDQLPEFPGGIGKFYNYIGNHFEKPELDDIKTIRVYVSFIIEKDGSMSTIEVKNNPGFGLDKEAIRVLKSLKTKWSPGLIEGKAVRTFYTLPITVITQ